MIRKEKMDKELSEDVLDKVSNIVSYLLDENIIWLRDEPGYLLTNKINENKSPDRDVYDFYYIAYYELDDEIMNIAVIAATTLKELT